MTSEDGEDPENYPDGEEKSEMFLDFYLTCLDSGEGQGEGQEGELDAMMGELTMDELKAAFRLENLLENFPFTTGWIFNIF